ncbi:MAG: hypothetical protein LBU04_03440 [Christensenellaceae bacterium]|nr:hypothetical protein [Christensenellaceae bacterium]
MKRLIPVYILIIILTACVLLTACSDPQPLLTIVDIKISSFPNNEYFQRAPINTTGAEFEITYSDGSSRLVPITAEMITGFNSTEIGERSFEIKYLDKTFTVVYRVVSNPITGIELFKTGDLEAGEYSITVLRGTELSMSDYFIRLNFLNGASSDLKINVDDMIIGYSTDLYPGTHTLKVKYDDFFTEFSVYILSNTLVPSQTQVIAANKKSYFVFDQLDPLGISIILRYDDDSTLTIPYTEETKDDFDIKYDFSTKNYLAQVVVTYKGFLVTDYTEEFTSSFTVKVDEPTCTTMTFFYLDENGYLLDGRPITTGITINGVVFIQPTSVENVVQGDNVDWTTGTVELTYNNGSKRIVKLNDGEMQKRTESNNTGAIDTNVLGNHTVWLKFGNVQWEVPLIINIIPRTPKELILHGTEYLTNRIFTYGETITYNLVSYNVLFNNGEYLTSGINARTIADPLLWDGLTIDMLSGNSALTISESNVSQNPEVSTGHSQTLVFSYENTEKSIVLPVVQVAPTNIAILRDPIKNYFEQYTRLDSLTTATYDGGSVMIYYNNGDNVSVPLSDDTRFIKKYYFGDSEYNHPSGEFVVGESSEEDYSVRVYLLNDTQGLYAQYRIYVEDLLPTSVYIIGVPVSNNYINFDHFPASGMTFRATTAGGSVDSIISKADIYSADFTRLGLQSIVLRHKGISVSYSINIVGRRASSFEIVTAPKSIYLLGKDTSLSFAGMRVSKKFNDQRNPEDVVDFSSPEWSYSIFDLNGASTSLSSVGEKKITMYFNNGISLISFNFTITVVSASEIADIIFDSSVLNNGSGEHFLTVDKGKELNLYGLYLDVYYKLSSGDSTSIKTQIPLLRGYVEYDPNVHIPGANPIDPEYPNRVALAIHYPGFVSLNDAPVLPIEFITRTLTSIEITKLPTVVRYPVHAELSLEGGVLKRTFNDSTFDYLDMTNGTVFIQNYNINPFEASATNAYVTQNVRICIENVFVETNITTYRKLSIVTGNDTPISGAISYYGTRSIPKVTLYQQPELLHFILPNFQLLYLSIDGVWTVVNETTGDYPIFPGTYAMKIVVEENDYYVGGEVEGYQAKVLQKPITVVIHDAEKIYGNNDPLFTFTLGEASLVTNNGVRDQIEIRIIREAGESVRYDGDVLGGYKLSYAIVDGDNQNSYYSIDEQSGLLRVRPRQINSVLFSGYRNLVDDGIPKRVLATYSTGYSQITIAADDIYYERYVNGAFVRLVGNELPSVMGDYRATVSQNYRVVDGANSITYMIRQR